MGLALIRLLSLSWGWLVPAPRSQVKRLLRVLSLIFPTSSKAMCAACGCGNPKSCALGSLTLASAAGCDVALISPDPGPLPSVLVFHGVWMLSNFCAQVVREPPALHQLSVPLTYHSEDGVERLPHTWQVFKTETTAASRTDKRLSSSPHQEAGCPGGDIHLFLSRQAPHAL